MIITSARSKFLGKEMKKYDKNHDQNISEVKCEQHRRKEIYSFYIILFAKLSGFLERNIYSQTRLHRLQISQIF